MARNEVYAEIDLGKIGKNVSNLKKLAGDSTDLMAVVKADGYGHGSVKVAETALKNGASFLGVARAHEAFRLRENNINAPVLTLGYPSDELISQIADNKIDISVYDYDCAKMISSKAKELKKEVNVHIKTDTGMGRVGIHGDINYISSEIKKITELPNIKPVGIFTHLASADEKDLEFAGFQVEKFYSLLELLNKDKINFRFSHCANSAGLINIPDTRKSLVRPGISIYGLYPSPEVDQSKVELFPAMTLKAKIVQVKTIKKGVSVSYGRTWKAPKDTKLATITLGYADGFSRLLSSNTDFLINGKKAPVRGRVCMDLCVADITGIDNVRPGDYATIIGVDNGNEISADYHAKKAQTINYEIVSALTSRVKRIYTD